MGPQVLFIPFSLLFWTFLILKKKCFKVTIVSATMLQCTESQNTQNHSVQNHSERNFNQSIWHNTHLADPNKKAPKDWWFTQYPQIIRGRGRPVTHIYWLWNNCSLYWRMPLFNCYIFNLDWCSRCHQIHISSFARSCPTLRLHGLQHARPPCPSPTPRVYSNSCPLS